MNIEKFYNNHHTELINLASTKLKRREDAECAVHDVFLDAIQKDGNQIFNDFGHMKNHYEKAVIARAIDIARRNQHKAGKTLSILGGVAGNDDSGGFNAILDKTDSERMDGDYGDNGPPSYDDYSEDSFP